MGGSTISTSETKIEALRLQSSTYGATIPVLGGVNRIPGNLIWYGDFKATPHTSTQSAGGKGGGVKTQNTTYTYSASVLMGICQGPVGAIARVWKGKEVFAGGWGPSQVLAASETYAVPASGAMTYTLAQGATLIGAPVLTWDYPETNYNGDTFMKHQPLASGVDFAVAGSVLTVLVADWRGRTINIAYQYGSGSPDLSPLTTLGITLASGDMAQAAAAWLTAAHPGEALAYPGLAYVHAQDYSLGTGASVDNHSFEVQGSGAYRYGATLPDCNPAEFTADVLVNGRYGARLPATTLDVAAWVSYCAASGLLMSPLLTEQVRAGDYIDQICKYTNSAAVWSVNRLRIVPYGDVALTGNGVTYTPNTTPLYDLDDDHWLQEGTDDPLRWQVKEPSNRYNHVRVEFADRAISYAKNIAEAKDDADIAANGLRTLATINAPWICDAAVAGLVARIVMQRSLNITGTGTLRLPWAYCLLECMDLVTLTDAALGFAKLPVRITSIGEDEDGMLEIEVEDWPLGSASPTRYPSQVASGFAHDFNAAPGSIDTPVIFEAPADLTATGVEVYAAVRGSSAQWGGCQVWVSLDGTTYKRAGVLNGGARYGTLSASAAGASATIAVQGLGAGQLISGSAADAAALATLCYVGGAAPEYLAYQGATLTGAGAYTLGGLVHAAYGTAAAAHASGAPFVRIDEALAMSGPLDPSFVGKTLSFKFCSFNLYGGGQQGLADVSAYTYTVTGNMANLANIAHDNRLTPDKKPQVIMDQAALVAEQSLLRPTAQSWGLNTSAYDTAYTALITTYLPSLTTPVPWYDLTSNTTIVGTTYRATWGACLAARDALRVAVDNAARKSGGGNLLLCGSMALPGFPNRAGGWNVGAYLGMSVPSSGGPIGNGPYQWVTATADRSAGDSIMVTTDTFANGGMRAPGLTNLCDAIISFYARTTAVAVTYNGKMAVAPWGGSGSITDISNPNMTTDWQRYAFQLDAWSGGAYGALELKHVAVMLSGASISIGNVQAEYGHTLTNYSETLYGPANTANLAANAATGRVSVSGAANTFTTTLTTVQTATFVTTGGEVTVWVGGSFSASGSLAGGAGGVILHCELWRDSTLIAPGLEVAISGIGGFSGSAPMTIRPTTDTPAAGSHTYTIKAKWIDNGGSPYLVTASTLDAALVMVEHKV